MAALVSIKPLQGMKCYRFTVTEDGQLLELPQMANTIAVYCDTTAEEVYLAVNQTSVQAPEAASETITETAKILTAAESPWVCDIDAKRIAFVAAAGKTVTVRVEAYYQHKTT